MNRQLHEEREQRGERPRSNLDLIVSIDKLDAAKKKLSARVQELAAHNKQLQQKPETATVHTQCDSRMTRLNRNSAGVSTAVYNRQKAELSQFRKHRDAEKVRRQVAVDMAEPAVKRELDGIRRKLAINMHKLIKMDGKTQALEAPFDGANGEATSSADVWIELEDSWLAEHEAARTIKGLSSIIGDLEDQVGKLEGDAATAATATKDAMEKMQKKIAKLDGELIEAEAIYQDDLNDMEQNSRPADEWESRAIILDREVQRLMRELVAQGTAWEEERIEVQKEKQEFMATAKSLIEG